MLEAISEKFERLLLILDPSEPVFYVLIIILAAMFLFYWILQSPLMEWLFGMVLKILHKGLVAVGLGNYAALFGGIVLIIFGALFITRAFTVGLDYDYKIVGIIGGLGSLWLGVCFIRDWVAIYKDRQKSAKANKPL